MTQVPNKVVVLGGGTGTFAVVAALKHCQVNISTVITVSDSGGSTGRIRDEFGFQPVGDLRQSLASLAENEGQEWIRKLLLYRFEKGTGLVGHNLGNLLLTALQDMTGDTDESLEILQKIFRIDGHVIPVTKENVQLKIFYKDGSEVVGEHILDETKQAHEIDHISLVPESKINPRAAKAIAQADLVIISPGDYYASIMATLAPLGIKDAFAKCQGKVMYILNLMTRLSQTNNMTAADHIKGIEKAIGRPLDNILVNNETISDQILELYAKQHEHPVVDDLGKDARVIRTGLIQSHLSKKAKSDIVPRSLLRHDQQKLVNQFSKFLSCEYEAKS